VAEKSSEFNKQVFQTGLPLEQIFRVRWFGRLTADQSGRCHTPRLTQVAVALLCADFVPNCEALEADDCRLEMYTLKFWISEAVQEPCVGIFSVDNEIAEPRHTQHSWVIPRNPEASGVCHFRLR
jgi:hypothetical protein